MHFIIFFKYYNNYNIKLRFTRKHLNEIIVYAEVIQPLMN